MFKQAGLQELYNEKRETLNKVNEVAAALKGRFYRMDEAIDCLMIAAMSGESMVMIGPPGTAKSRLVRAFCHLIGLIEDDDLNPKHSSPSHSKVRNILGMPPKPPKVADQSGESKRYFEYLLTQFTEPGELFGFYDLAALSRATPDMQRITKNMMQEAEVVFLDEVFNASSAILNALLTFMNERVFHDRGEVNQTKLRLLVSATNHPPRDVTLQAVYDRFLLRCWVHNIAGPSSSGLKQDLINLAQNGWRETHATNLKRGTGWKTLLDDLTDLQDRIDSMTLKGRLEVDPDHALFPKLTDLVSSMVRSELSSLSNRRLIKMMEIVLCTTLMRAARADQKTVEISSQDLDVFYLYSVDRENVSAVEKLKTDVFEQ